MPPPVPSSLDSAGTKMCNIVLMQTHNGRIETG